MALVLALAVLPLPVEAGLLTGTFVGDITRADDGNKLGVSVGDTFSLAISIDPDLAFIRGADTLFSFRPGDASFLSLQVGGLTFDEEDEIDFEGGFLPIVVLSSDRTRIVGIDLVVELGLATRDEVSLRSLHAPVGFADLILEEDIDLSGGFTVGGRIAFVPEPPFALGLGLAAFAWLRRRRA